jgi:predicted ATPase
LKAKKIVITGGPGTGKSSIIYELKKRGFYCFDEISRDVTLKAREDGIEQLFLTEPMRFSELLLKGRIQQFKEAETIDEEFVFMDRGIPDVLAYMDFINDDYPKQFKDSCNNFVYSHAFILAPWQDIFSSDSERYENFDQAIEIHKHLLSTYKTYDYSLLDVPFGSIESRTDFILNVIQAL